MTQTPTPVRPGQSRWRRDLNPCRRICSPLPRLSATPPRRGPATLLRADDEVLTRDLNLGKVALYQLSYVRTRRSGGNVRAHSNVREHFSRSLCHHKLDPGPRGSRSGPSRLEPCVPG